MNDLNEVIVEGRLGGDPHVGEGNHGKWASFNIAVNKTYKDKSGEKKEITNWIPVMSYGRMAEIVDDFIKKGDHITIKGSIQTRDYTNKEDKKVYVTEVIANTVRKNNWSGKMDESNKSTPKNVPINEQVGEDDLPF